jgi:hypothetical protein
VTTARYICFDRTCSLMGRPFSCSTFSIITLDCMHLMGFDASESLAPSSSSSSSPTDMGGQRCRYTGFHDGPGSPNVTVYRFDSFAWCRANTRQPCPWTRRLLQRGRQREPHSHWQQTGCFSPGRSSSEWSLAKRRWP